MFQIKKNLKLNKNYIGLLLFITLNKFIFTNDEIKIISLNSNEWFKYKDIRLKAVQNCSEAFGTTYAEELKETKEDWIDRLKHNMLFAIKNENAIGMIGAVVSNSEKKKHRALLISFYIDDDERKNGIGTKLLKELINLIKSKYNFLMFLDLYVTTTQKEAIELYKKFGFTINYCMSDAYFINGKFYDQYFMSKKI